MEERFEIKMYGVNYKCKECKTGNMCEHNGKSLCTNPPQYLHKCDNCDAEEYLLNRYPLMKCEDLS